MRPERERSPLGALGIEVDANGVGGVDVAGVERAAAVVDLDGRETGSHEGGVDR